MAIFGMVFGQDECSGRLDKSAVIFPILYNLVPNAGWTYFKICLVIVITNILKANGYITILFFVTGAIGLSNIYFRFAEQGSMIFEEKYH